MGQQISHVGDQNVDALCEQEARANVVEADCRYLSSRIERFIKLVQSRLATRVYGQPGSPRHSAIRQQLLQEDVPLTSSTEIAPCNILPLHFTDISAVGVSFDTDEHVMGVAVPDVLIKPVGLYCHVPLKKIRKVDTCNVGCQTVNDNHHSTAKTQQDSFENLLTEISFTESEVFTARNNKVKMNENNVAKSKACYLSKHEVDKDAKSRFDNSEGHSRRRPPQSSKLITTAAQLAHETRPTEIGSYLAVAPVVSSSDIGLSPIDETVELVASTALLCPANTSDIDSTCKQTPAELSNPNFSSDAVPSGNDCRMFQPSVFILRNLEISQSDDSAALSFGNNTNIIPLKTEKIPQSGEGFLNGESNINVAALTPKSDVLGVRKLTEDACRCPVNTYFYLANGTDDETDRSPGRSVARMMLTDDAAVCNTKLTDCVKSKLFSCLADECQLLECRSSATSSYAVFLSEDNSFCSLQTSNPFLVSADTASLSANKAMHVKASESNHMYSVNPAPELHVPHIAGVETSASDLVWTEWETALSCCDWSANNNESGKPVVARVSMSPGTGPMVARHQVRHSSEVSSPHTSSVSTVTAEQRMSTCVDQDLCQPAINTSQSSVDDVIASPPTVPDHVDFLQLEIFEGTYSVVYLDRSVVAVVCIL